MKVSGSWTSLEPCELNTSIQHQAVGRQLFFFFFADKQKIENSHSTRSPPHDNAASRASHNYAALTEHGPNRCAQLLDVHLN